MTPSQIGSPCGAHPSNKSSYRVAHAAGQDAGNRSVKDRGLTQWDEIAWDVAAETFEKVAGALR